MKTVIRKGLAGLLVLVLGSLPAMAEAKSACWTLQNGTEGAGQLRLRVMDSSGKTHFLLNGTRDVQDDNGGIQSFPITGGGVKMGSSAKATLTETGTSADSTWATQWHLDLSAEDLNGTASAITTATDGAGGFSSSAAFYDAIVEDCAVDDDDSSDDASSDDESSDDEDSDDDEGSDDDA